jgi:hypothetical protein
MLFSSGPELPTTHFTVAHFPNEITCGFGTAERPAWPQQTNQTTAN